MDKGTRNKQQRKEHFSDETRGGVVRYKEIDYSRDCVVVIIAGSGDKVAKYLYERPCGIDDATLVAEAIHIFADMKLRGVVGSADELLNTGVARSLDQAEEMGVASARIFDSQPDAEKILVKCYIEEYIGDSGLSARLREKDTGRHVKLGIGTAWQKAHFLRFLSALKARFSGSDVFTKSGLRDYVEVSGNLQVQDADEICVAYDSDLSYLIR